jgi:trehalose 6-phosphate phosphatase
MNVPVMTVERLARVLSTRPAGLITDLDGTISGIAPAPELAMVGPEARNALSRLVEQIDLVAIVSGRPAAGVQPLVGLEGVVYVGNHGLERLAGGRTIVSPEARLYLPLITQALGELQSRLSIPNVFIENKGATASVHYRQAADPEAAKSAIVASLQPIAERHGLRVGHGRMVVELRPPGPLNKGTALRGLGRDYHLRSVAFLGDDVTDLDAMRALRTLRNDAAVDGLSIGVAGPETPEQIMEEADLTVSGVDAVVELLNELANRLE